MKKIIGLSTFIVIMPLILQQVFFVKNFEFKIPADNEIVNLKAIDQSFDWYSVRDKNIDKIEDEFSRMEGLGFYKEHSLLIRYDVKIFNGVKLYSKNSEGVQVTNNTNWIYICDEDPIFIAYNAEKVVEVDLKFEEVRSVLKDCEYESFNTDPQKLPWSFMLEGEVSVGVEATTTSMFLSYLFIFLPGFIGILRIAKEGVRIATKGKIYFTE